MELLFESRSDLASFQGHLNFVQCKPILHPEPVVRPDTFTDGKVVHMYGTVMRDGGRLRMWYQAYPQSMDCRAESSLVAYAESDDGIHWRKPTLNLVDLGAPNSAVNLGLAIANIWIDPDSPPQRRYRATGVGSTLLDLCRPDIEALGYYTAHSADGLDWKLDAPRPRWYNVDNVNSIYHPGQRRGIITMKQCARVGRILRRCLQEAQYKDGQYSDAIPSLYPDEFDDIAAMQRGYASSDYYDFAMQPAGSGTVGFLCNYWHSLPYTCFSHHALYGTSDITLVFQERQGARWLHMPGRPNFFERERPWMAGWVNTANCPIEMGDEHWLYFGGRTVSHGFCHDAGWQPIDRWLEYDRQHGASGIGFVRWPKWRLFGFESDPDGAFTIHLPPIGKPSELFLNYKAKPGGAVRAAVAETPQCTMFEQDWWRLTPLPGRGIEDSVPLTCDSTAQKVTWKNGSVIAPSQDRCVVVRLELDVAGAYAYELRPAE